MPLYEYHCTHCGENTEFLQKMSDHPEKTCPYCHQDTLLKQISATQFQLKGSGWYATDFRGKKENKAPEKTETPTTESKPTTPEKVSKKDDQ